MKLFGNARAIRGSIAWTNPFRVRVIMPEAPGEALAPVPAIEYDEDGRQYAFRYAGTAPRACSIDRDRIFDYLKRHKLPAESDRQIRRDLRNSADVYSDLRDLQTHPDVEGA